jgi:TatD DNase family protein
VRAAYGIHPYFLAQEKFASLDFLEEFAAKNTAIAIGEIGLDYWPGSVNYEIQKRFLLRQLDIANNLHLPVILHARKSYDELASILKKFSLQGIVHAFTGSEVQAKRFIEQGLLLGVGASVTYPRAQKTRKMLKNLADQDFVLETDSPDMPLFGLQGQRNEPANLAKVAAVVAQIREQDVAQIADYTSVNLVKLFRNWN